MPNKTGCSAKGCCNPKLKRQASVAAVEAVKQAGLKRQASSSAAASVQAAAAAVVKAAVVKGAAAALGDGVKIANKTSKLLELTRKAGAMLGAYDQTLILVPDTPEVNALTAEETVDALLRAAWAIASEKEEESGRLAEVKEKLYETFEDDLAETEESDDDSDEN